nr:retrovirus-related Pol polyprotein from transposon TNT 1-94 [Tanacetum cinerariifolium]
MSISVPGGVSRSVPKGVSRSVPKEMNRSVYERMSISITEGMSRLVPEGMSRSVPKEMNRSVYERMSISITEGMSRLVPEGMKVRDHPIDQVIGELDERTLRSHAQDRSNFFAFVSTIKPKNIKESIKDESYIMAMQVELDQFIRNDVWDLIPCPVGHTVIGTKWVFRNKLDKNGIVCRNKARLVAHGYNQQEGIDYDETYAPVARLESIRILLAYACCYMFKLFQMDVKSDFLNGVIDEKVYVMQPLGFVDFQKPNRVYKLKKALYGLKQAPKACLLYLTASRLDIMFSVCLYARYQKDPKNKDIEIRHHFLKDSVAKKHITIEKIPLGENVANSLTRPLENDPFGYLRLGLGLMLQDEEEEKKGQDMIEDQEHFKDNALDPWILTLEQGEQRSRRSTYIGTAGESSVTGTAGTTTVIFVQDNMSRDVITVGSTMRIPLLYMGEYLQWRERFMNYLEEQTDGEAMINSIQNGLPNDIYSLIESNETAKDLWDALERQMCGSEYGEQDRKAAILYEYETFKAIKGEQFLDTYLRYLQVINNLKKCGYKKDNCELNYKFLNNLQQEWKQYGTLMRQTKNLMDININALYNILKQNQGDVNDALGYKKKAVVVTSDPLALVAEKTNVSKQKEKIVVSSDSEGSGTDDFSELKKITALLAKAFNRRKFYSKPTNNNLRTSSTSQSANKKQEFVKSDDKKVDKKADEKKRDMSKDKCYVIY